MSNLRVTDVEAACGLAGDRPGSKARPQGGSIWHRHCRHQHERALTAVNRLEQPIAGTLARPRTTRSRLWCTSVHWIRRRRQRPVDELRGELVAPAHDDLRLNNQLDSKFGLQKIPKDLNRVEPGAQAGGDLDADRVQAKMLGAAPIAGDNEHVFVADTDDDPRQLLGL